LIDSKEIAGLLDRLANGFENAAERPSNEDSEPTDTVGWGQFLDAPKQHKQVGMYGTCAGIIVLAVAGRGDNPLSRKAVTLMDYWWNSRSSPKYSHKRLAQTPRLAFANLALRISGIPASSTISAQVEQALLSEVMSGGIWGNYWTSEADRDNSPRIFPSALALLSFNLMRSGSANRDGRLLRATHELEGALAKELAAHEAAAVTAALLSTEGESLGRRTRSRIDEIAIARSRALGEGGVYFYDYQYDQAAGGATGFGRDYFIVPTEILLGIAGFQVGAPSALRMRAESTLDALVLNIREHRQAYLSPSEQRITSKNQAWAALLLSAAARALDGGYKPGRLFPRVGYEIRRERKNRFFEVWFPFLSMIAVTILGVALRKQGGVIDGIVAVAVLLIGGLYGPTVVRRLFPGYK